MSEQVESSGASVPDEVEADLTTRLDQLKAQATQQYSLKNYTGAAEYYSEAAELQDEVNGEMSPLNADLLYQYGRCLYHVAVSKSDVLGGKVAGDEPKRKKRKTKAESSADASANGEAAIAAPSAEQKTVDEVVEQMAEEATGITEPKEKSNEQLASRPFFQISGDENWVDSDEEDEEDSDAEEEEDDFAIAYEILDVARVLLARRLDTAQDGGGKRRQGDESSEVRQLKERLADTHDLQAEISLENERFHDAISDTRDALALKLELFPQESSLLAEAHFKLSLALEFASVTSTGGADDNTTKNQIDEEMRKEAAAEMEKAIASCRLRIAKEEEQMASLAPAEQEARKKSVADVKDMVQDMNNRLVDLRNPATSLSGPTGPAGAPDGSDPLRGILGSMLGESTDEQRKRIAEATAGANDLSGLIKHRKKPKAGPTLNGGGGGGEVSADENKGKRKAEELSEVIDAPPASNGSGKKVKFED